MIIPFKQLKQHAHSVAMVDGGFDPLHEGHIAYFAAAAAFGVPVLCNLTSDRYVRTKHPVLLPMAARAAVIDALESIEFVHPNEFDTETVLRELKPRYYVKGKDWDGRLPQEQIEICAEHGIEIVYLDLVTNSSSSLLKVFMKNSLGEEIAAFETFALAQSNVGAENYDDQYFVADWREQDNCYTVETRRKIEGKNPQLIKDVFQPSRVVDMGCGPGALMCLLDEIGVLADGVDFSAECKEIAPENVRDRITVGSVTDVDLPTDSYDLVICREVFEHLTVLQVQKAIENICRIGSRFVYVTTRFHPDPGSLFDVTNEFDVDPTHITLLNKDFLRLMFVLQGFRRRPDLENEMDWLNKNRVLVYEKTQAPG